MSGQQTASACPHPEAVGTRWGDPISEERQAELQGYLDRWEAETDHGERKGSFDLGASRTGIPHGVPLTGADVSWLAESGRNAFGSVYNLRLEGADLYKAHLEGAALRKANLEGALFTGAHLEGADLSSAYLEGVFLNVAHLDQAIIAEAHLEGAKLGGTHLEGAYLSAANLKGADLRNSWMDKATALNRVTLERVSFDQATFDNTNLSVVDWKKAPILGDELTAQAVKDADGKRKSRYRRILDYQGAVRAYRRLAVALQANGLSAEAANYLYRASIMERRLARHERRVGAYFFSVLLAVLAGYGYRLGRIVVAYLSVVLFFAALFLGARYLGGGTIDVTQ
jgi:uncharacterized protein YjbI with pentapeptide repeats